MEPTKIGQRRTVSNTLLSGLFSHNKLLFVSNGTNFVGRKREKFSFFAWSSFFLLMFCMRRPINRDVFFMRIALPNIVISFGRPYRHQKPGAAGKYHSLLGNLFKLFACLFFHLKKVHQTNCVSWGGELHSTAKRHTHKKVQWQFKWK